MISICEKCGKQSEGNYFSFYHGLKMVENGEPSGLTKFEYIKQANGRTIQQFYSNVTEQTYFLCKNCMKEWTRKKFWQTFIFAVILTPLSILYLMNLDRYQESILKLLAGVILLTLTGACLYMYIRYLFPMNKGNGEEMAIQIAKTKIHTSDTFWDSEDFRKLS
jgi:hypothetical protein